MIVQSQMAVSGPARQTIASLTPVIISGLSINFTPIAANSTILVKATIISTQTFVSNWSVYKNGLPTVSTAGFTNNSSSDGNANITTFNGLATTEEGTLWPTTLIWSEISGSLAPRTYDIRAQSEWLNTAYNLHINNRVSNDMASFSFLKVIEFVNIEE